MKALFSTLRHLREHGVGADDYLRMHWAIGFHLALWGCSYCGFEICLFNVPLTSPSNSRSEEGQSNEKLVLTMK
jgi:hypothetical protein